MSKSPRKPAVAAASTLPALREQHEAAKLAAEIEELRFTESAYAHARGARAQEAWGDLIDPYDYARGEPDYRSSLMPFVGAGSRDQGRNLPIVQTEQDISRMRAVGRFIADSTPTGKCVLLNLKNFILGKGIGCQVVKAKNQDTEPSILAAVQCVVDQFIDDNDWEGDLDRELFGRDVRDGEWLLALFHVGGGRVAARVIEPDQLTEPTNAREIEDHYSIPGPCDWTFGVCTDAGDVQQVHGYYVRWNASGSDWDYLPASQVEHSKRNVDRNVKRGISDFYAVQQHLEDAEKLLRNTRKGAAIQAAIAFIREHVQGTTQSQVEGLRNSLATRTVQRTNDNGSTSNRYITRYEPGTVLDVPNGQQYKPSPLAGDAAPEFIAIHQAVLRSAGSNWCMPEYMVTGDASNAAYASTMVAESPFVKNCESEQSRWCKKFRRVLWKALKIAADAGRFDSLGVTFDELESLVELKIEPPRVAVRDANKETEQREKLAAAKVLSRQTWAAQENLDYDEEQANIEADGQDVPTATVPPEPGTGDPAPAINPTAPATPPTADANAGLQTELTLNGAQVTSALELLGQVRLGSIASTAALELLVGVGIPRDRASAMLTAQEKLPALPSDAVPPAAAGAAKAAVGSAKTLAEAQAAIADAFKGYP